MAHFAQRGLELLEKKQYDEAIIVLDKALATSDSPAWLLTRSKVWLQKGKHELALGDAEFAYHAAVARGSDSTRAHMIDAQYRRSVILFAMGRYADADCCARWSQLLSEGRPVAEDDGVAQDVDADGFYAATREQAEEELKVWHQPIDKASLSPAEILSTRGSKDSKMWNRAFVWRCQTLGRLAKLPPNDPARRVTVTKVPPKRKENKHFLEKAPKEIPEVAPKVSPKVAEAEAKIQSPKASEMVTYTAFPLPAAETDDEKPVVERGSVSEDQMKLKTDFYQTASSITATLFVKGVNAEALKVDFQEKQVIVGPLPREAAPYVQPGDPESYSTFLLNGTIKPKECRYSVTPRKIELVLQKNLGASWATRGTTWATEQIGRLDEPPTEAAADLQLSQQLPSHIESVEVGTAAAAAANPTEPATAPSYPSSSKRPQNWEALEDSDGEDEAKKDADHFFKSLYAGATPDQRRAMMKSFVESNGTSLSTDWADVGARTVAAVPPEGVEQKKW